jgi:DNA-binding response OmpR family regulator
VTYNILIVEDNEGVSKVIGDLIKSHDPRVKIDKAETLADATHCLHGGEYDAVLLDLKLPDSDPECTYKNVSSLTDAPIVVLTSRVGMESMMKALGVKYHVKPDAMGAASSLVAAMGFRYGVTG